MQIAGRIATVAAILAATGCATILTGSKHGVKIRSNPESALVTIKRTDGVLVETGTTPMFTKLPRNKEYVAIISLDGYNSEGVMILRDGLSGATFLNLAFWPGFLLDYSSGAMFKLRPNNIGVALGNKSTPTGDQIVEGQIVSGSFADDSTTVDRIEGQRIRVTMQDNTMIVGTVESVARETLKLSRSRDAPADQINLDEVAKMEVSDGIKTQGRRVAGYGFSVGATLGLWALQQTIDQANRDFKEWLKSVEGKRGRHEYRKEYNIAPVILFPLGGTLIGAAIGSAIREEIWVPIEKSEGVSLEATSYFIRRTPSVGLRLRF